MSIRSAPYYWVECDNCGERAEYSGGEISAWKEAAQAVDGVVDDEWSIHGDKHHCPRCPPLCQRCGESAGELSGERDYHCVKCWTELEAADAAAGVTP